MTDILITFEDGSTELRPWWSPCVGAFERPTRHPSEESLYLHSPEEYNPLFFCDHTVMQIRARRGSTISYCWRITGQNAATKALTGEWCHCRIETEEAQIARLTRERDEAREVARRLAALDHDEAPSTHDGMLVASWGGPRR